MSQNWIWVDLLWDQHINASWSLLNYTFPLIKQVAYSFRITIVPLSSFLNTIFCLKSYFSLKLKQIIHLNDFARFFLSYLLRDISIILIKNYIFEAKKHTIFPNSANFKYISFVQIFSLPYFIHNKELFNHFSSLRIEHGANEHFNFIIDLKFFSNSFCIVRLNWKKKKHFLKL